MQRMGMNIAGCCNLKCKNCLAFVPYYEYPWMTSYEDAKKTLQTYFSLVERVDRFTITGGEPLLNPDFLKIIEEAYLYKDKITNTIDIVTNGTMMIPDDILDFFEQHKTQARMIVSNYGAELSTEIGKIEETLIQRGITYRISQFSGDDLYYDGWIDFSDHSLKWKTIEERKANAAKCIHATGQYFSLIQGNIYRCSRSYWRMHCGIVPKVLGEYVPLMDDTISIQEKKALLQHMVEQKSGIACAYCVGLCNDVPRIKPAIQLSERGCAFE